MDLSPAAVDCLASIIISLQISLFKDYRIVIDAHSLSSKQAIYLPFTSISGIIKGRNPQHSRRTLWRISFADPRTSHSAKERYLSVKQVVQYHWFVLTFVALMPLITRYFLPATGSEVNACTISENMPIQFTHQFGVNLATKISSLSTEATTPRFLEDADSSLETT